MKTPRLTDFDPEAKVPALKSALDHMPVIEKPQPLAKNSPVGEEPKLPVPRPVRDTPSGTPYPVRPLKRRMRQRQPFDVYEDQYETLKRIAEEERAQGLPGSMSRMVREGIDMYLAEREKGEEKKK